MDNFLKEPANAPAEAWLAKVAETVTPVQAELLKRASSIGGAVAIPALKRSEQVVAIQ